MKKILIVVFVLAFASAIAFVLYLWISGQVQFVPDRFAEEFLKFLANLASIVFGFLLINVYWEEKEQRDKRKQVKQVLLGYLLRINRISSKIISLLSLRYSEGELDNSRTRDAEIASLKSKLEKLTIGLESLAIDPSLLGDPLIQKIFIELIREGLLSDVDTLVNQQNFRKSFETFVTTIRTIESRSSEGVNYLTLSKKMEV
jgi:hypothetical protein